MNSSQKEKPVKTSKPNFVHFGNTFLDYLRNFVCVLRQQTGKAFGSQLTRVRSLVGTRGESVNGWFYTKGSITRLDT